MGAAFIASRIPRGQIRQMREDPKMQGSVRVVLVGSWAGFSVIMKIIIAISIPIIIRIIIVVL